MNSGHCTSDFCRQRSALGAPTGQAFSLDQLGHSPNCSLGKVGVGHLRSARDHQSSATGRWRMISRNRIFQIGGPQSHQTVLPGVRNESKKSPKLRLGTLFGLRGALFGDSGAPRGQTSRDTLSNSFRTLLGFRARRAQETSVPGQAVPKSAPKCTTALQPQSLAIF